MDVVFAGADTTKPTVASRTPASGATGVDRRHHRDRFSEAVTQATTLQLPTAPTVTGDHHLRRRHQTAT